MSEVKKYFFLSVILLIVIYCISVNGHEVVHQQNFLHYGVDSNIQWLCKADNPAAFFNYAIACTIPNDEQWNNLSESSKFELNTLNQMHESASYQQQTWGLGIIGLVFVIGAFLVGGKK